MTYDVAIVGAGLAGLMAANMLAEAGRSVALIDAHDRSPPDFRCEKFEHGHASLLETTGLLGVLHENSTLTDRLWIARYGSLLDVVPFEQFGFRYGDLLNAFRRHIGPKVTLLQATVQKVTPYGGRTQLSGTHGLELDARLVILSTGLNRRLRQSLGLELRVVSPRHSLCVGFDLESSSAAGFRFPALQYNPEENSPDVGYLSLFRIGSAMRANLFVYHSADHDILTQFRSQPDKALHSLFPTLGRMIGASKIVGPVLCRPSDLSVTVNPAIDGVVLIGDAYMTVCPSTGLGAYKAMNDAVHLCTGYVEQWLESGNASAMAIRDFYQDAGKRGPDRLAMERGDRLKTLSTQSNIKTYATRWFLYQTRLTRGWVRSLSNGIDLKSLSLISLE